MATIDKYSTLTTNQRQAVLLNKGDALISASAGSGKTHVIIERIIRLILEGKTTVDRLLAVTFTKLAAFEMKEKLKSAVLKEIINGNASLKWQYDEINYADISTIDSFCSKIVKKYFYKINVDYSFEILDESKRKTLKAKAIDDVLSYHYENQSQDFLDLAFVLASSKNDDLLRETLSKFMLDSESNLDVNQIFDLSINTHLNASTIIGDDLTKSCHEVGTFFEKVFSKYLALFEEENFICFIKELLNLCQILKGCKSVYDVINSITFANCPKKPTNKYGDFFYQFKDEYLKSFTTFLEYILNTCGIGKVQTDKQALESVTYIKTLQTLCNECLARYDELKKEENSYDFCDIEKFAYALLCDQEVLSAVKNDYDFIFIDEYQDVNGIQESIINLLAQNNEFMVGDSKQSIYAFRGCNPNYFINKFSRYDICENQNQHAISLDNNFRSAKNIINSVNNVFSHVFTKDFGGFDYAKSPMIFNENYYGYDGECALHLYKENEKSKETPTSVYSVMQDFNSEKVGFRSNQVTLIASLILDAINNKTYYDIKEKDTSNRFKKFKYKDICILFRTLNEKNIKIIQELNDLGIPVTAEAKIKLNSYPEVKAIIELIKAINTLNDDIALSTTMSTIYGFTFDQLASIRKIEEDSVTFYDAVISFSKKDGSLNKKVADFLEKFEEIRLLAEYEKADEILFKVLDESGYETRILTSPFGEYKLKRIKRLINESCKNKRLTVKEFGVYLEDAIEDISTCETSGDDAVKVMTIHASKGLEFPYVILAGAGSDFNFQDVEKVKIIKNEKYGFCIKRHDKESMTISETPLTLFIKNKSYVDASLEEARILYVAMTRAMFKLDILSKDKNLRQNIPFFIKHSNCFIDFFNEKDLPIIKHDELISLENSSSTLVAGSISKEETVQAIVDNFNYVYPYKDLTKMPVKVSVSAVSHNDDEIYETTTLFGETTKEMGTAYHKILQLIHFYSPSIDDEIVRLKEGGLLSSNDLLLIDVNKVKSILKMDIFNQIKDYSLYKEEKFTFFIEPSKLGYDIDDKLTDKVLVQGIIDLMAVKNDKCILIDYKLSSLKNDDDLIKVYKTQLSLYKDAIEKCLGLKVEKVYLINILQEKLIELN